MKNANNTAFILGLVMAVFYFAIACMMLFTSFFEKSFAPVVRYVIGTLFLLYSIFRAWRLIKLNRIRDEE